MDSSKKTRIDGVFISNNLRRKGAIYRSSQNYEWYLAKVAIYCLVFIASASNLFWSSCMAFLSTVRHNILDWPTAPFLPAYISLILCCETIPTVICLSRVTWSFSPIEKLKSTRLFRKSIYRIYSGFLLGRNNINREYTQQHQLPFRSLSKHNPN